MTRIHVKLMYQQRGYTAAKKVLVERKARGEFFVLLEMLERDRRVAQRRRSSEAAATLFILLTFVEWDRVVNTMIYHSVLFCTYTYNNSRRRTQRNRPSRKGRAERIKVRHVSGVFSDTTARSGALP
jgi:hypothetical protein